MRFLFVMFLSTLCCCKAATTSLQNQVTLQKIVDNEIGVNATIEKNSSAAFALAFQVKDRSVEYIVVRLADLKIVVKEKINQGSVTWSGDMRIKVTQTPGIVKMNSKPEDNIRFID